MKKNIKNKKGFTLISLILYISMLTTVLLLIYFFAQTLLSARVKNQVITEVEIQGVQIMNLITQATRNASGINLPTQGQTGQSLSLAFDDVTKNPTVFSLSGQRLQIQEGTSTPVFLNSSKVNMTEVSFYNLSRSGTDGNIKIEFTLSYENVEGRKEYDYAKKFFGSATIRY